MNKCKSVLLFAFSLIGFEYKQNFKFVVSGEKKKLVKGSNKNYLIHL